jgi:hypothetical protein
MAGVLNFKTIDDQISQEIEKKSFEEKVSIINNKILQLESRLRFVPKMEDRLNIEKQMDVFKNKLETIIAQESKSQSTVLWEGYPDFDDDKFNFKIYNKEEFNRFMIPKKSIDSFGKEDTYEFKKSPTQNFIGTYMSPFTPYNSLLLWLGVGVGKTCSAITAAENYRKEGGMLSRSKITVLLPSNSLLQGWKTQIFNLSKELKKPNKNINVQCTGDTFQSELPFLKNYPIAICEHGKEQSNCNDCFEIMKKKVNKMINKYYLFMGYRKFANMVKEDINRVLLNKPDREYLKIEIIRKKYSNHIFILDEVHLTREHGSASKDSKDIAEVLELIARYGVNNKFILASATPMYNSADEIIDILNIMLLNDKRAPIDASQVFKSDGYELTQKGADILKLKSRGYISFLRGENPATFPIKIYPHLQISQGDAVDSYIPDPTYSIRGTEKIEISSDEKIKHFSFIKCSMSQIQYETYQKAASEASSEADESERDRFSIPSTLASIVVYPLDKTGNKCYQGDAGFDIIFKTNSYERYSYTEIGKSINGRPFLVEENLAEFSSKFYNILQLIKRSEGICFFHSRYLKPGILSLALMLEQNGYARFVEEGSSKSDHMLEDAPKKYQRCFCGVLKDDHSKFMEDQPQGPVNHKFKQGRYIFLTGNTPKPTLDALINESNYYNGPEFNENNLWGQRVKFVLGSNVLEQGINLYCVREVHIIDPWHHFNRTEQVVGRAIRNFSHKNLPADKRNVSVYLHCATIPAENDQIPNLRIETTDEKTYRNAYNKSIKIANITRLLKQNAVDCLLNKNGNQLTVEYFGNRPMKITTSQGKQLQNMYYGDSDGDIMCDYEKCVYTCNGTPAGNFASVPLNTDTFDEILMTNDLHQGKQFISRLFLTKNAYTIDEIVSLNKKIGNNMSSPYIFRSINEMIQKEESVFDKYHREGLIIYKNPFYLFQPLELNIDSASFYTRNIPLPVRTNEIVVSEDLVKLKKASTLEQEDDDFIANFKTFCNEGASRYVKSDAIYKPLANQFNNQFLLALSGQRGVSPNLEYGFELLTRYFIFCVIDRLSFEKKQILISYVLKKYIKNGASFPSDNLERTVMEMYTHPPNSSKNAIFDLGKPSVHPKFRLYRFNANANVVEAVFFKYDDKNTYVEITNSLEIDKLNKSHILKNTDLDLNSKIYGYLSEKMRQAKSTQQSEKELSAVDNSVKFYLVDKRKHTVKLNKDFTEQSKSDIKGSVCGTNNKNINKQVMVEIIFELLNMGVQPSKELTVFLEGNNKVNSHFEKKTDNAAENIYTNFAESGALCELIEILLRHRQYISPDGENYFFNFEEWEFKKTLDTQEKEKAQEAEPEKRRGRPPKKKE